MFSVIKEILACLWYGTAVTAATTAALAALYGGFLLIGMYPTACGCVLVPAFLLTVGALWKQWAC